MPHAERIYAVHDFVFRFDDVSVNTKIPNLLGLIRIIRIHKPNAAILLCISPIVFAPEQLGEGREQRVHPPELTAMSSLSPYYRGNRCGLPYLPEIPNVIHAGHGLLHVDHRLLGYKAQEMSILASCSLARSKTFVPPYNHYDDRTKAICEQHGIDLVQFEHGWRHASHQPYEPSHTRYYCHPYDFDADALHQWFLRGEEADAANF